MITDQGGFCITSNFSELFPLRNEQFRKISELHLNTGSRKDAISTFDIRNQYLTAISVKVVSQLNLSHCISTSHLAMSSLQYRSSFFVSFSVSKDIIPTWWKVISQRFNWQIKQINIF